MREITNYKKVIFLFFSFALLIMFLGIEAGEIYKPVILNHFSPGILSENSSKFILYSSDENFSIPETPFQKILKSEKSPKGRKITIKTGTLEQSKNVPGDLTQDTRFLNINTPGIQKLRKKFLNSRDVVKEVESFVYNFISKKTFGIPITPVKNILVNRSGDCTEHAILSIAILRSLKIPSRAACGMIFCREFQGIENVFVFHMWAEAYYRGKWIIVDSTLPKLRGNNLYITFSYHHLKTEIPLSYLKAISAIKDLSVEYSAEKTTTN